MRIVNITLASLTAACFLIRQISNDSLIHPEFSQTSDSDQCYPTVSYSCSSLHNDIEFLTNNGKQLFFLIETLHNTLLLPPTPSSNLSQQKDVIYLDYD